MLSVGPGKNLQRIINVVQEETSQPTAVIFQMTSNKSIEQKQRQHQEKEIRYQYTHTISCSDSKLQSHSFNGYLQYLRQRVLSDAKELDDNTEDYAAICLC